MSNISTRFPGISQHAGFADKPISALIQEYLDDNKDNWKPNVYKEYKALYRQVIGTFRGQYIKLC